MKKYPILLLFIFSFILTFAQEKKAITHEAMWMLKRVGSPAVSPDGNWVVFSVTEPAYDEKEQVNDIWIVPSSGTTAPRRLTSFKASESSYTWSPNNKYIAFVAKRDGDEESQIYLLNMKEGGDAQKITNTVGGASSPSFSLDAKNLLFTGRVFPGCYTDSLNKAKQEEVKKRKYKARVYTTFPIRSWDRWLDEKQSHLFIQSVEPGSTARNIFSDVTISKGEGFRLSSAAWSPDGKEIIFAASTDINTAAYNEPATQLFKVAVAGGDAIQITSGNRDHMGPRFTEDGRYLICFENPNNNGKVYNLTRLTRFDWPGMQNKSIISEQLHNPIESVGYYDKEMIIIAQSQGRGIIYKADIETHTMSPFSTTDRGYYKNISISEGENKVIVATYENTHMPTEIVKINKDGSHTFLSNFNKEKLDALDLGEIETFWFTNKKGAKIRSMVVKPAGFDPAKKYPLFVVMHGGPHSSWKEDWGYRWNYHLLAKPGYVLVLTDYTGSTGYGEKFAQDIQMDPFRGPAHDINEAAALAIKKYPFIDGSRQAAGGASYGGHLANWMEATTTHYKCLINHAGLMNSVSQWASSDAIYNRELMNGGAPWTQSKVWQDQNPINYASKFKTPMLVTVGELDYRVPMNNAIETWHVLQRQKVPGKLILFPDENHWIMKAENSKFFYAEVHEWLGKYLAE